MIEFSDDRVKKFWETDGAYHRPFSGIAQVLMRKLRMLNAAKDLQDLRIPPGNRLEALQGDRKGQYSIRINNQYRICFTWTDHGPANVAVVDYH